MSSTITKQEFEELQSVVYIKFMRVVDQLSDDKIAALLGLVTDLEWVSRPEAIKRIAFDIYYCKMSRGLVVKLMQTVFENID